MFASSFASNLARVCQKHTNCLNRDMKMMLWVRCKPATCLTGLKVTECQLTKTTILDNLQSVQCQKMLKKCLRLSARMVSK